MEHQNRILLVEGSGRGFLCHYAHALALGLTEIGHCVRLVEGSRDELESWRTPFDKTACFKAGWVGWACLAAQVRAFAPDVVHFQWIGDPLTARLFIAWLKQRGIATVYTPHNLLPHRRRWLSQPGFHALYRAFDRVVARDAHIVWGLEEMFGLGGDRVVYLPGSPNLMAHPEAPRRRAPELSPKQPGEVRLLYFGHGSHRKGLDHLLAVLARGGFPPLVKIVIAGEEVLSGTDPAVLASARAKVAIEVLERYVDPSEVADLFTSADLLLMPYAKTCKSPLLDLAGAFALPVLRSDRVEAVRFDEGMHGLTVSAHNGDALAAALNVLVASPGRLAAMRQSLAREESVMEAIHRLALGHARLYADMTQAARAPESVPRLAPAIGG